MAAHALPLRTLRLSLSPRWQVLRRQASTSVSPHSKPSFIAHNRGRIFWTSAALITGLIAGSFVSHTFSPPALPSAGTREDDMLLAELNQRLEGEFIIRVLRGRCLGIANRVKGQSGGLVELVKEDKQPSADTLATSLAGFKGLGVERIFWDNKNEKLIAIIWFGPSLSGWPGVTHGGMIATQMMERIGLASTLLNGGYEQAAAIEQSGSSSHSRIAMPSQHILEPEELSLSYVKPTYANGFYILRVAPTLALPFNPMDSHDLEAKLETMDGKILVTAKAKMPELKSMIDIEQKVDSTTMQSFRWLHDWLWPSGQPTI